MSSEAYRRMIAARIADGVARAEVADRNPEDELVRTAVLRGWKSRMEQTATPQEEIQAQRNEAWQMALLVTPVDPQPYRVYGPGY